MQGSGYEILTLVENNQNGGKDELDVHMERS